VTELVLLSDDGTAMLTLDLSGWCAGGHVIDERVAVLGVGAALGTL
jgi:hypothetical protein